MSRLLRSLWILLVASPLACAETPRIEARYAPEFTPGPTSVAILGAFHAGRLSAESWSPLSARVSGAFGTTSCEVAWSDALKTADPDLHAKIDEEVAENGITDEMLGRLAPKTDAELIVTVSVLGRIERSAAPSAGEDPTLPGRRPGAMGGMRGRSRGRGKVIVWRGIELAASLFSVKLRRGVGRITLRHPGTNMDEAARLFAEKLHAELGGSTCRAWRFAPGKP